MKKPFENLAPVFLWSARCWQAQDLVHHEFLLEQTVNAVFYHWLKNGSTLRLSSAWEIACIECDHHPWSSSYSPDFTTVIFVFSQNGNEGTALGRCRNDEITNEVEIKKPNCRGFPGVLWAMETKIGEMHSNEWRVFWGEKIEIVKVYWSFYGISSHTYPQHP